MHSGSGSWTKVPLVLLYLDCSDKISFFWGCVKLIEKFFDPECAKILRLTNFTDKSQKCSDEIIESTVEFENITNYIDTYSIHHIGSPSIQADFDHILADIEFEPNPRKAFFKAISFIKSEFDVSTQTFSCKEIEGCF